jgi:hypothetical protein
MSTKDVNLWHQWLGHLGIDNSRLLTRQQIMDGLSINKDDELEFCEGYVLGKQHRESLPKEGVLRASEVLRLIHCDVWGLAKTTSFGGVWYFLTFTNDCLRKTFFYFLRIKGECISKFWNFKAFAKMQ